MPPFTMIKRRASLWTSAGALGQSSGFARCRRQLISMLHDFLVGAIMALDLPVLCFWVPDPRFGVVFKDKIIMRASPVAVGHNSTIGCSFVKLYATESDAIPIKICYARQQSPGYFWNSESPAGETGMAIWRGFANNTMHSYQVCTALYRTTVSVSMVKKYSLICPNNPSLWEPITCNIPWLLVSTNSNRRENSKSHIPYLT